MSFEFSIWRNLIHELLSGPISVGTNAQITLSTTSSQVAIPLELTESITVDLFEVYLASGASTDFRCRIVTSDATTGNPTTTLVDGNATASITASSGAWNQFDFTNFSLAAGRYWICLDSTSTPGTALAIEYNLDFISSTPNSNAGRSMLYWTGSAWAAVSSALRGMRARLKTTDGWHCLTPCAPLLGASGIDSLIMDTSKNPACRGIRFVAPYTGQISGVDLSVSGFSTATSFEIVMANSGCTSELARVEYFQGPSSRSTFQHRLQFPPVSVTAGTSYDLYVTAGSQAAATTGLSITAIDTSEDSGNVVRCYGVEPGDVLGLSVNSPVTEGGSDTPTTTSAHVFPWSPIYSSITTGGGGGGETAHVFAA